MTRFRDYPPIEREEIEYLHSQNAEWDRQYERLVELVTWRVPDVRDIEIRNSIRRWHVRRLARHINVLRNLRS